MKVHRLRVRIGTNSDGTPITTQINASSEIALANRAALVLLASGRRNEFIEANIEKKIPKFRDYAPMWLNTYK